MSPNLEQFEALFDSSSVQTKSEFKLFAVIKLVNDAKALSAEERIDIIMNAFKLHRKVIELDIFKALLGLLSAMKDEPEALKMSSHDVICTLGSAFSDIRNEHLNEAKKTEAVLLNLMDTLIKEKTQ